MTKYMNVALMTVSALALTACFSSSSKNAGSQQIAYQTKPIQGSYADNNPHAVYSTDDGEAPTNTRFTVQFTADEKVIVADNTLNKSYTFTADQVQGDSFHSLDHMMAYVTELNNSEAIGGEPDWNDQVAVDDFFDKLESISVVTPTNTNNNEYALARVSTKDGQQWMLIGDPTSTTLSGTATYKGGYYSAGVSGGHGTMTMAANFAGSADAIDVTLNKSDGDATNSMFGAPSVNFTADFNNATNTISASGKPVSGGHYDTASMEGAFFANGNASAGLIHMEGAGAPGDFYGGYHVVKD